MRKAVVLSFLILCIQSISAQGKKSTQTATVPTFVTSVEGVKEYTLANGLQILLVPDASIKQYCCKCRLSCRLEARRIRRNRLKVV
jgi:hypothetical protein